MRRVFLSDQFGNFLFQPFYDLLFQAGYITLRDPEPVGNVLLRHLLLSAQSETHVHDAPLAFGQFFQRLFQQFFLYAGLHASVHRFTVRSQDIGEKQLIPLKVGIERLVKRNFTLEFDGPAQIHEDLILDAARGICGKFDIFIGAKGVDRLDQSDGADGYQIVSVHACIFKFSGYVDDEPQIMFDELCLDRLRIVARFQLGKQLRLLFGRKRKRQRFAPAQIMHDIRLRAQAAQPLL